MEHNKIIEQNDKVVKIRQEFIWHYAVVYLENLKGTAVMCDEKFKSLFDDLYKYLEEKCRIEEEGEISAFYMVFEMVPYAHPF